MNAAYTLNRSDRPPHRKLSFKKAIGLAVEWRIIAVAIDFCAAYVLYALTKKAALSLGLGAVSLIKLAVNALWIKYRVIK